MHIVFCSLRARDCFCNLSLRHAAFLSINVSFCRKKTIASAFTNPLMHNLSFPLVFHMDEVDTTSTVLLNGVVNWLFLWADINFNNHRLVKARSFWEWTHLHHVSISHLWKGRKYECRNDINAEPADATSFGILHISAPRGAVIQPWLSSSMFFSCGSEP